jgi:hypothetical protein
MKSIFEKWDTCNPVNGDPRYGVRYYDEDHEVWVVQCKVGRPSLFRDEVERDAWLAYLQKKERKLRIRGLH